MQTTVTCASCATKINGPVVIVHWGGRGHLWDHAEALCDQCARERAEDRRLGGWDSGYRDSTDRSCETCGRSIRSNGRYCSRECHEEGSKAARRVTHQPRACEACHEMFIPKRSDARTCSDRCRQAKRRAAA